MEEAVDVMEETLDIDRRNGTRRILGVAWDEIESIENMKEFLESKIQRAELQWETCNFGMDTTATSKATNKSTSTTGTTRQVGPAKVHLMEETLKLIPQLRSISINLSGMDPYATTFAAIALSRSPFIETVDLYNEKLGYCHPEILRTLLRGISQNNNPRRKHLKMKNLVLSDTRAAKGLQPVGRIFQLTEITCCNCSKSIAKALLDAATQNPTVRVVKFGHNRHQDTQWESTIAFSFRNFVGSSQSLQYIEIGPVSPIFLDNIISPLAMNRTLQELVLTGCNGQSWEQTGKKVAAIIHASPSLKRLVLRSFRVNARAWSEIALALRKNTSLVALHLDWEKNKPFDRNLTAPDFRNLARGNGILKELKISGEYLSLNRIKDFEWAIGETGLESLIIRHVGTEFACATFAALAFNKNVRKLDIEVGRIREPFASRMRDMLQVNRTITSLAVRCACCCFFGRCTVTVNDLLNELTVLFENRSCYLEALGIHGVSIRKTSGLALPRLLNAISQTESFKSWSLLESNIDVASYRILCEALPAMKYLRHLDFSFPVSQGHEQLLLAQALEDNESLTSICCQPFPPGIQKVALSYCNRNRLRLFQEDQTASPAYLPYVFASLRSYGADHSAVYLTVRRYLGIFPTKVSCKRPLVSIEE